MEFVYTLGYFSLNMQFIYLLMSFPLKRFKPITIMHNPKCMRVRVGTRSLVYQLESCINSVPLCVICFHFILQYTQDFYGYFQEIHFDVFCIDMACMNFYRRWLVQMRFHY